MAPQQESIFRAASDDLLHKLVEEGIAELKRRDTVTEPNGRYGGKTWSESEEIEVGQYVQLIRQRTSGRYRVYWLHLGERNRPITERKEEALARLAYELLENKAPEIWGDDKLKEDFQLLTLFVREVLDAIKRMD